MKGVGTLAVLLLGWILMQPLAGQPLAAQPSAAGPPGSGATVPSREARVVVIDPGHGGYDPGSVGSAGVEEKAVALAVGLALARVLDTVPGLEVHLIRDADVAIPVWERGDRATHLKGDRPGVLLSLHVNALDDPHTRGVETYFLSQARTEHERRVAALENAPPAASGDVDAAASADPGAAAGRSGSTASSTSGGANTMCRPPWSVWNMTRTARPLLP